MTSASLAALLALSFLFGCRPMDGTEVELGSAFSDGSPTAFLESVPIGPTRALRLTRPAFTATEVAQLTRSMGEVVTGESLLPAQVETLEAAAVEARARGTLEFGSEVVEFRYRPRQPSILVGTVERVKPRFTEPGVYEGVGRGAALEAAQVCADALAAREVIAARSYLREPVLERAPGGRLPAHTKAIENIENIESIKFVDHYHFVFGRVPDEVGILLGDAMLTIDVDARTGDCFRIEASFVDYVPAREVELIVSVAAARAAVEAIEAETGGARAVAGDGWILYSLDPGVAQAVVEPRYVDTYSVFSESGMATRSVGFAVTLSVAPPLITEF